MSWTDPAYHNGFLVLDRNGDGVINDGSELFGSETSQPATPIPNGFNALAIYDLPVNGGNGNGVIDAGDAIYNKLRVWIDTNHDGFSQASELHALQEFGITTLGLGYHLDRKSDQFGNRFRYEANLGDAMGVHADHFYDVILLFAGQVVTQANSQSSRIDTWNPATAAIPVFSLPSRLSETPPNSPSEATSVTLIGPHDPRFMKLLREHFPYLRYDHAFPTVREFLAFVINKSDNPLNSFSVRWEISDPAGNPSRHEHYSLWAFDNGPAAGGPYVTAPVLPPDGVQLVSPFFRWNVTREPRSSQAEWHSLASFTADPVLGTVAQGALSAAVRLDYAELSNGQHFGDDEMGFAAYADASRRAAQDEIAAVASLLEAGSVDRVRSFLHGEILANPVPSDDRAKLAYSSERGRTAARLLLILAKDGIGALRSFVEQFPNAATTSSE